jgi:hypothetical protein
MTGFCVHSWLVVVPTVPAIPEHHPMCESPDSLRIEVPLNSNVSEIAGSTGERNNTDEALGITMPIRVQ